jgi:hypothetical protein
MATPPQICNTIEFEGSIFQRCNLQVVRGTTVIREITLCDTNIILNNFSSFSGCVYGNSSLLLTGEGLNNVDFVMIKATYPSTLPVASKFINIIYNGSYLPMGNLTILTGNSNYIFGGWDLDPNGSDIESPYFEQGGMLLYNPHSVRVNVEVIIGEGLITSEITNYLTDQNGQIIVTQDGDFITF